MNPPRGRVKLCFIEKYFASGIDFGAQGRTVVRPYG